MNRQEIFNRIATHLITQNARAIAGKDVMGEPKCAYRGADGTKCAVGCLIADEAYRPELEGKNCEASIVVDALAKSGIPVSFEDGEFLREIQRIHDFAEPADWPSELADFGKDNRLSLPACLQ